MIAGKSLTITWQ